MRATRRNVESGKVTPAWFRYADSGIVVVWPKTDTSLFTLRWQVSLGHEISLGRESFARDVDSFCDNYDLSSDGGQARQTAEIQRLTRHADQLQAGDETGMPQLHYHRTTAGAYNWPEKSGGSPQPPQGWLVKFS